MSSSSRWGVRDIVTAEEMWLELVRVLERKEMGPCDIFILQTAVTAMWLHYESHLRMTLNTCTCLRRPLQSLRSPVAFI